MDSSDSSASSGNWKENIVQLPTRREILRKLEPFARSDLSIGLKKFLIEYLLYWTAIAGATLVHAVLLKVLLALFAGIKLSNLLTVAHDAAHGTFVPGKRLNKIIAQLCFLPVSHNFRVWVWDHHERHHRETNGPHFDTYVPMSLADFKRAPFWRQMFERTIRHPNFVGFGLHYLFQRMGGVRILPPNDLPAKHKFAAWRDFFVIVGYLALYLIAIVQLGSVAGNSWLLSITFGWLLPIAMFTCLTGGSLFLMHTHPDIPWFKGGLPKESTYSPEMASTHIMMPRWLSSMIHNVFCHSAHHAHPRIPNYRLYDAQLVLNKLLPPLVVNKFSLTQIIRTMKICKLYDYENHQWLDFDGKPIHRPRLAPMIDPAEKKCADVTQMMSVTT